MVATTFGKVSPPPPFVRVDASHKKAWILWDRAQEIPDYIHIDLLEDLYLQAKVHFGLFRDASFMCK